MPGRQMLHPIAAGLMLGMAVALVIHAEPSSASSGGLVAFDFPPAGMETRSGGQRLAEFLGPSLGVNPGYILGIHALAQVTVAETDGHTLSIRLRNLTTQPGQGEPWILTQRFSEQTEAGYRLGATELPSGIEIFYADVLSSPKGSPLTRVRAFAPPGDWIVAEDEREASEALASRLGLPPGSASWNLTVETDYRLPVYNLEPPDWNPHVYLECACSVWARHDLRLGGVNSIVTVFTEGHELVAVEATAWVNLSGSRILAEGRALEMANASLKERGHDVETLHPGKVSVSYSDLHLVYRLTAFTDTEELSVVQNAHTGDLESVNAKIGDALPRQSMSLPAAGPWAIFAALGAGALLGLRRVRQRSS